MTINARQTSYLRCLSEQPRGVAWFVAQGTGYAPAVLFNLTYLVEIGYAEEPINPNGPYRITEAGQRYLDALPAAAPSRSFTQRAVYVPQAWTPARSGADQHLLWKSRGIGA
jgi:hypothetical protein